MQRPMEWLEQAKQSGKTIVFTNGCFDLLHVGHLHFLEAAKTLGDLLVVGLNSDQSVRRLKGKDRPVISQADRKKSLESLRFVDAVLIFEEDTPLQLIKQVKPHFLVKGGDYDADCLSGADFVRGQGGQVVIIERPKGYSTTQLIQRIKKGQVPEQCSKEKQIVKTALQEQRVVLEDILSDNRLLTSIDKIADTIYHALSTGKRLFTCGNGGSMADAQHLTAELIGRFQRERSPLASVTLGSNPAVLTALANDYGYEQAFSRELEGLAQKGDVLLTFSTSGQSSNIKVVIEKAHQLGLVNVAFLGERKPDYHDLLDACLNIPSSKIARIQECHTLIFHIICELVDEKLAEKQ